MSMAPQLDADYIIDDGTCAGAGLWGETLSFGYAYTADYSGYGAALMYSSDSTDFGAWFVHGYPSYEAATAVVSFDSASGEFEYENGYRNYEYTY